MLIFFCNYGVNSFVSVERAEPHSFLFPDWPPHPPTSTYNVHIFPDFPHIFPDVIPDVFPDIFPYIFPDILPDVFCNIFREIIPDI